MIMLDGSAESLAVYSAFHCSSAKFCLPKKVTQCLFLIKLSHNACLYLTVNLKYTPDSAHITHEDKCCATLFFSLNLSLKFGVLMQDKEVKDNYVNKRLTRTLKLCNINY
jgi:hypothetical protein